MSIKYLNEKAIEEDKFSIDEFDEWLWEFIDEDIVPNKFIDENPAFCQAVAFNAWQKYVNSNVSHQFVCEIIKDIFVNLFNNNLLDNSEYEN